MTPPRPCNDGSEYRLRRIVLGIWDSFECGELGTLRWIQGKVNTAGPNNKLDPHTHRLLNGIARTGLLSLADVMSFEFHSTTWK